MTGWPSAYHDEARIAALVATGRHREAVGGRWAVKGPLQLRLLQAYGLLPSHRLIDLGCGALCGGVQFVRYLDPAHYYGIDISQALIDAGLDYELAPAGLAGKLPRGNLVCNGDFALPWGVAFDFAIAHSLFTHLPIDGIGQCLARTHAAMAPGGRLLASYHPVPEGADPREPRTILRRTTYPDRDPYHYRASDLAAAAGQSWRMTPVPDDQWLHPRQKMALFERR